MTDRPSWGQTWMRVAVNIGQRSKCVRDQVGAVIISNDNRVIASGYNGPPATLFVRDGGCDGFCPRARLDTAMPKSTDYSDCVAVHAEMNAMMCTTREQMKDAQLFVNSPVCWSCAKVVANSGIKRVWIMDNLEKAIERGSSNTNRLLQSCGIEVVFYDQD
jgi:dCMP deaminase